MFLRTSRIVLSPQSIKVCPMFSKAFYPSISLSPQAINVWHPHDWPFTLILYNQSMLLKTLVSTVSLTLISVICLIKIMCRHTCKSLAWHSNQNNIHFVFSYSDKGQTYMQVFGMAQQPELYYTLTWASSIGLIKISSHACKFLTWHSNQNNIHSNFSY